VLRAVLAVVATLLAVTACGSTAGAPQAVSPASAVRTASSPAVVATSSPTPGPVHHRHHEKDPDPRWRFYTADHHWYSSPWFRGMHRIMIGFGCNASPWYAHDPRCPGTEGFHHGIDVAMSCGTPLRAGIAGVVLPPSAPGTPGAAYGVHPFRIRITGKHGSHDVLIGHARTVFVRPGHHVRRGQRIARASDSGAPDGCHLHFEVRPPGGGYTTAVAPRRWLRLHRAS
jgi:murein DD-endopeptidase MepM/ murein hydrolase activator NlpD